jgi:hypothetical protein
MALQKQSDGLQLGLHLIQIDGFFIFHFKPVDQRKN